MAFTVLSYGCKKNKNTNPGNTNKTPPDTSICGIYAGRVHDYELIINYNSLKVDTIDKYYADTVKITDNRDSAFTVTVLHTKYLDYSGVYSTTNTYINTGSHGVEDFILTYFPQTDSIDDEWMYSDITDIHFSGKKI